MVNFKDCVNLRSITIGSGLENNVHMCDGTDTSYFYGCSSIESITVTNKNKNYCSIDGVLYSKDKRNYFYILLQRKTKNMLLQMELKQ